jgi:hypothetical protein
MYWKLSEKRQRSKGPVGRGVLERGRGGPAPGRVRAAVRGEKRRGHDDLDLVAEGDELLRGLARAAADVEDAERPGGRRPKSLSV